ncbi:hypothetical protein PILCRDRAFT_16434 [Piloderma croceum F 1598]|uniref:Uncharacterized protein n=1 Tax=Piloderma croceum (strain F 1598) TaxID=765440 RepID=A0A0C3EWJ5_PILCF|nr:hypothetical protein PILCRDRAFT_16434 [Piloderma croceum F 1598]
MPAAFMRTLPRLTPHSLNSIRFFVLNLCQWLMVDELGETLMKGLFKNFPWVCTITFICEVEIMDEKRALETMPRMLTNAAMGLEHVEFWTMGHSILLDMDLHVLKVRHHGDRVTYGFMCADEGKWVLDDENSYMQSAVHGVTVQQCEGCPECPSDDEEG